MVAFRTIASLALGRRTSEIQVSCEAPNQLSFASSLGIISLEHQMQSLEMRTDRHCEMNEVCGKSAAECEIAQTLCYGMCDRQTFCLNCHPANNI